MKQFIVFVKKEFYHVLRDRKTLLILFGLPIVQILIFGFALTNEVKNSRVVVADFAKDPASQMITTKIEASRYFDICQTANTIGQVDESLKNGKIKAAIIFPENFNHDLLHEGSAMIQVITDASDPNLATTVGNYLSAIISDFEQDHQDNLVGRVTIIPETRMLYNPQLKGEHNFVPGVMALVLMLICVMMTAISIVREKETGTMEILLVSPFRPQLVVLSKAVPYLVLSLINICTILAVSVFILKLPVNGSIFLLFAESTLFIITCLSLGLLISVRTQSQQVAMLISLMGMLLPTLLFSGFMFPIENMPRPLQWISNIIPAKWFYIIAKSIMIKGLGFAAIWKETVILIGITLFLLTVSIKKFKIRLA